MQRNEVIDIVMNHLKSMYKDVSQPTSSYVTRWGSSNLSFGSYSYYKVGTVPEMFDIIGKPHAERILFAGEGSISRGASFANGAYLSGMREANRVMEILNGKNDQNVIKSKL